MLVISRKEDEAFVVDGPCKVTVTEIRKSRVTIAIEAERSVRIVRVELLEEDNDEAT